MQSHPYRRVLNKRKQDTQQHLRSCYSYSETIAAITEKLNIFINPALFILGNGCTIAAVQYPNSKQSSSHFSTIELAIAGILAISLVVTKLSNHGNSKEPCEQTNDVNSAINFAQLIYRNRSNNDMITASQLNFISSDKPLFPNGINHQVDLTLATEGELTGRQITRLNHHSCITALYFLGGSLGAAAGIATADIPLLGISAQVSIIEISILLPFILLFTVFETISDRHNKYKKMALPIELLHTAFNNTSYTFSPSQQNGKVPLDIVVSKLFFEANKKTLKKANEHELITNNVLY